MTMEGYSAKGNTRGGGRTSGGAGRAVGQDERCDRTSGGQDERMVRTVDGTYQNSLRTMRIVACRHFVTAFF